MPPGILNLHARDEKMTLTKKNAELQDGFYQLLNIFRKFEKITIR